MNINYTPITGRVLAEFAVWWFSSGTVSANSIETYMSAFNHILDDKGMDINRQIEAVICAHTIGACVERKMTCLACLTVRNNGL